MIPSSKSNQQDRDSISAMTATAPTSPPSLGSHLFRIRRTFALDDVNQHISAIASHSFERRQLLAIAVTSSASASSSITDAPHAHTLIVRSIEEDRVVRHWRFPLAASRAKQDSHRVEPVVAMAFSPEGDWLACVAPRKNRLHLVPVATLIASHRRTQLARAYVPPHNREWMGVAPSAMTVPMASYLRATNEAGGRNGARYHSRVAGDDAQMSTLEFAAGMGRVTCCRWWRSMNGKDYCLVGGSEHTISIVNVQGNAEECRCELQQAGEIESIELFHEAFRKEKRTSMLVQTRVRDANDKDAGVKYYRVVLEKKTLRKATTRTEDTTQANDVATTTPTTATEDSASVASSADGSFKTTFVFRPPSADVYTIKTFPEHFVEDMDFRPQRIKKNRPEIRLQAINGLLSSESGLAMYDGTLQKVSVYSNFQWSLKGQYNMPSLVGAAGESEAITDIDIAFCTSDLMLLQGKRTSTGEFVSTWVSLPSRPGFEEDDAATDDEAHLVHHLTLHDSERVERVVQCTSVQSQAGSSNPSPEIPLGADTTGEVIYIIQTAHNLYECRPQWSRLALFRALRSRSIALRDAQSIGYALGIDMASLCEVVADTLVSEIDAPSRTSETSQWIYDLYEASRAGASKAVRQLALIQATTLAIQYGKRVLGVSDQRSGGPIPEELESVALQVVDLILQEQLQYRFHSEPLVHSTLRPRDPRHQDQLDDNQSWLKEFLRLPDDSACYRSQAMIDVCLNHSQIDKAFDVAVARDAVAFTLTQVCERGLTPMLAMSTHQRTVQTLLDAGYAQELLQPSHRSVLRSLSIDTQLAVMVSSKSATAILRHRDWIVRHVRGIPKPVCAVLAELFDPSSSDVAVTDGTTIEVGDVNLTKSDVSSSEFMEPSLAERIELFVTLLLRLNDDTSSTDFAIDDRFSQRALEGTLRDRVYQYRPPILIARCVDFENWSAAASLYEAHGELVDAVECRLHSHHRVLRFHRRVDGKPRRRQSSHNSLAEDEELADDDTSDPNTEDDTPDEWSVQLKTELLELIDTLVIRDSAEDQLPADSSASAIMRAAILARIVVKWFEYGLSHQDLEVYLIDAKVFAHVAAPLSKIFFSDIVDRIGGKSFAKASANDQNGRTAAFDERDKAWVRRCHTLPFSGQFLFHVCTWFLNYHHSQHQSSTASDAATTTTTAHLLSVLRENIDKNDLAIRAVRIEPHSAQTIGKSDPLETHVKVFSCGHVFPKRVFEEDVLPEFEKRMNALPTPLFATKQLLLAEFRRSHVEAPCPVCTFNSISTTIFHNQPAVGASHTLHTLGEDTNSSIYFLHGLATVPAPSSTSSTSQSFFTATVRAQRHEEWEWRHGTPAPQTAP